MPIRLGDIAPDFKGNTTNGVISFHDWIGDSWCILFSHPADFTPVCTTEIGAASKLEEEFKKRNTKIIAISIDTLGSHEIWIDEINKTQNTEVSFPLIADENMDIALLYGMIHPDAPDSMTVRSVFIIDPDKRVKLMLAYPVAVGRNFNEILRALDALQLAYNYPVATPADWQYGDDCIIAGTVPDEDIPKLFPKGSKTITPYLRMTPQPNK